MIFSDNQKSTDDIKYTSVFGANRCGHGKSRATAGVCGNGVKFCKSEKLDLKPMPGAAAAQ
jgi:hypothetical protein